jgi:hypothetical protein
MNPQSQGLMRAITGPIILITVGVLFTVEKFTGVTFGQTWPVLLIVVGTLKLLGGRRPRRIDTYYAPPVPPFETQAPPSYAPPYPPPPPPPPMPGERR